MKTADAGTDPAARFSHGFREGTYAEMVNRPPRIKDVISGILLLAAGGKDPLPLEKVHETIHAMKPGESILTGLRFSVTGAVCYSRDIDQAIHFLTDGGFLEIVDGSVFPGEHGPEFRNYLAKFLSNTQLESVQSASLRFHERVRRDIGESRNGH